MFGKNAYKNRKYLLLSICKNDIYHCGIYSNCGNSETITSINTGNIFYNLEDFVNDILETKSKNEWKDCLYYNETKKRWRSVKYLLKKI
jgi:hypothetical protein